LDSSEDGGSEQLQAKTDEERTRTPTKQAASIRPALSEADLEIAGLVEGAEQSPWDPAVGRIPSKCAGGGSVERVAWRRESATGLGVMASQAVQGLHQEDQDIPCQPQQQQQHFDPDGSCLATPLAPMSCPVTPVSAAVHSGTAAARMGTASPSLSSEFSSQHAGSSLHPEDTLIIFDWDDTLCPTTFIRKDLQLNWSDEPPCFANMTVPVRKGGHLDKSDSLPMLDEVLRRHVEATAALLRFAARLGRVAIVTLAKQGWVEMSSKSFLPGLWPVLEELQIEIFYARNSFHRWKVRSALLDELDVFRLMKEAAMRRCIRRFDSHRPERSWRNVISIGDSWTEHDALAEVVMCQLDIEDVDSDKPCHCKTVKLDEEPHIFRLTVELEVMLGFMEAIFRHEGDLDLDLSDRESSVGTVEPTPRGGSRCVRGTGTERCKESCKDWIQSVTC